MFHSSHYYQDRRFGFHPYKYPDVKHSDKMYDLHYANNFSNPPNPIVNHARSASTGNIGMDPYYNQSLSPLSSLSPLPSAPSLQESDRMEIYDTVASNVANMGNTLMEMEITASEHLLALLQREAKDYSIPLPARYYPYEFDDDEGGCSTNNCSSGSGKKGPLIGPWRKRIASWMYDVVDHFKYDRNVVSVALRYIDEYVSYLLLRGSSGSGRSPVVKRRQFQLIAVTSLYLAIKIHGELQEEDNPMEELIDSLLAEVDGPIPPQQKGREHLEEEEDDDDDDEDIRAISSKLSELRNRQRIERVRRLQSSHSSHSPNSIHAMKPLHPIPFKPRKRGMLSGPLRLTSFVELSRGLFTALDITDTESKLLHALNYVVNPPTSRRFVGELLRLLVISAPINLNIPGEITVDRKDVLLSILTRSCNQTENASSIPPLSLGCLPSVVGYAAILNAVEEEFDKYIDASSSEFSADNDRKSSLEDIETKEMDYQLEDFQRHYRRYARSQSAPVYLSNDNNARNHTLKKSQYFEEWKERFHIAVYHASNCFLSPDAADIYRAREILLDAETSASVAASTEVNAVNVDDVASKSPNKSPKSKKSRSPRSPRSVIVGMPRSISRKGSSFLRNEFRSVSSAMDSVNSITANVNANDASNSVHGCINQNTRGNVDINDSTRPCSSSNTRMSILSSSALPSGFPRVTQGYHEANQEHDGYQERSSHQAYSGHQGRQTHPAHLESYTCHSVQPSQSVHYPRAGSFTAYTAANTNGNPSINSRATTPELNDWRNKHAKQVDCWRSEAFQPPPFFSA